MNYFLHFFETIKNAVFLSSSDSDEDRAKKIVWYSFFASLVLISLVAYILFVSLSFSSKGVTVPHITGDTIYTGLRKLSENDLSVRVATRYSDSIPEGIIMSQSPNQGSFVRAGRKVSITVSIGTKEASLPDFRQMTLFEAAHYLDTLYPDGKIPYKVSERNYEFSDTVDKGYIIRQEPAEGTPVRSVKTVKFWISNGIKTASSLTLPDFTGMKLYTALKEIEQLELNANISFIPTDKRNEHYSVTSQSIDPGQTVDELIRGKSVILLGSPVFLDSKQDFIRGEISAELPKKNIPYTMSVIRKEENGEQEEIFTMNTRGGFAFSIPYSVRKFNTISIITDGNVIREITAQ